MNRPIKLSVRTIFILLNIIAIISSIHDSLPILLFCGIKTKLLSQLCCVCISVSVLPFKASLIYVIFVQFKVTTW